MIDINVTSIDINGTDYILVDTIKDDTGKKVELPKEEINKDKPAEVNTVSKDEEDPELAEIAAEIAKMEAEEAANKKE